MWNLNLWNFLDVNYELYETFRIKYYPLIFLDLINVYNTTTKCTITAIRKGKNNYKIRKYAKTFENTDLGVTPKVLIINKIFNKIIKKQKNV